MSLTCDSPGSWLCLHCSMLPVSGYPYAHPLPTPVPQPDTVWGGKCDSLHSLLVLLSSTTPDSCPISSSMFLTDLIAVFRPFSPIAPHWILLEGVFAVLSKIFIQSPKKSGNIATIHITIKCPSAKVCKVEETIILNLNELHDFHF